MLEKLNITCATDLIHIGMENLTDYLANIIESNSKYQEDNEKFNELISNLDNRLDIEACVASMEDHAKDTAFNEGFRLATQLIFTQMKKD